MPNPTKKGMAFRSSLLSSFLFVFVVFILFILFYLFIYFLQGLNKFEKKYTKYVELWDKYVENFLS